MPVKAVEKGTCYAPDCDRPAKTKGLCGMHYQRKRKGKDFGPPDSVYESRQHSVKGDSYRGMELHNSRIKYQKAQELYALSSSPSARAQWAGRMKEIITEAEANGFTADEVTG